MCEYEPRGGIRHNFLGGGEKEELTLINDRDAIFSLVANLILLLCLLLYLLFNLFIFGCIGSLLLRAQAFSSCSERGLLFVEVHGLLIAVASLVVEHGL